MRHFDAINLYPDKSHKEFLSKLSYDGTSKSVTINALKDSPFPTNASVWFYGLCYAVKEKLTPRQLGSTYNLVSASIFSDEQQLYMALIAIKNDSISIIEEPNKMLKICNELANAGLEEIKRKIEQEDVELDTIEQSIKIILDIV